MMAADSAPGMERAPEDASAAEERALWAELVRTRDAGVRNRLIERHLPLARILAAKLFSGRRVQETEFDDYLHYAALGLIEAVDKFDPSRNVLFRTFAAHRIQGSVLNNVERLSERDEQLALKSRLRKQRLASLREGRKEGEDKTSELFEHMAEVAVGLALGYMLEGSGMYLSSEDSHAEDVYSSHEMKQLRATVNAIVELLPERERNVIKYHYYHGLGVTEIGEIFGLSKGRISQIHREALRNLRDLYARAAELNVKL
jgi:RNA polymerase sigma factor for flagellar operon FliA